VQFCAESPDPYGKICEMEHRTKEVNARINKLTNLRGNWSWRCSKKRAGSDAKRGHSWIGATPISARFGGAEIRAVKIFRGSF
jgi:hypothetical protein